MLTIRCDKEGGCYIRKYLFGVVISIVIIITACCACTHRSPEKEDQQGYLHHLSLVRLDKQNDVFYELGGLVEKFISGSVSFDQIDSFCAGVNIFTQNDIADGIYDLLYQAEIAGALETLQELMSTSNRFSSKRLEQLDDAELENLATICYDLGDCCDRGKTNQSLAYFLSVQDLSSESYHYSLQATNTLLDKLDELI